METKHCPICTNDLPVSEFGICRARKDGRNLYCKSCIREKVTKSRRALKEYKLARKKYEADLKQGLIERVEPVRKLSPHEKVLDAIKRGYRTQLAIKAEAKLSSDEIGDQLCNLLLWTHEIKSQLVDGERIYLLNVVEENPSSYPEAKPFFDLARKAGAPTVRGDKRIQRVA